MQVDDRFRLSSNQHICPNPDLPTFFVIRRKRRRKKRGGNHGASLYVPFVARGFCCWSTSKTQNVTSAQIRFLPKFTLEMPKTSPLNQKWLRHISINFGLHLSHGSRQVKQWPRLLLLLLLKVLLCFFSNTSQGIFRVVRTLFGRMVKVCFIFLRICFQTLSIICFFPFLLSQPRWEVHNVRLREPVPLPVEDPAERRRRKRRQHRYQKGQEQLLRGHQR